MSVRDAARTPRRLAGDPSRLLLLEPDDAAADEMARRITDAWPQLRIVRAAALLEAEAR